MCGDEGVNLPVEVTENKPAVLQLTGIPLREPKISQNRKAWCLGIWECTLEGGVERVHREDRLALGELTGSAHC